MSARSSSPATSTTSCTHARDRKVAAWLQETAEAFGEIGEIDLVNDWVK